MFRDVQLYFCDIPSEIILIQMFFWCSIECDHPGVPKPRQFISKMSDSSEFLFLVLNVGRGWSNNHSWESQQPPATHPFPAFFTHRRLPFVWEWIDQVLTMGLPWVFHGFSMGFPWVFHGFSTAMIFPCFKPAGGVPPLRGWSPAVPCRHLQEVQV